MDMPPKATLRAKPKPELGDLFYFDDESTANRDNCGHELAPIAVKKVILPAATSAIFSGGRPRKKHRDTATAPRTFQLPGPRMIAEQSTSIRGNGRCRAVARAPFRGRKGAEIAVTTGDLLAAYC
jgi:hypothetical protein